MRRRAILSSLCQDRRCPRSMVTLSFAIAKSRAWQQPIPMTSKTQVCASYSTSDLVEMEHLEGTTLQELQDVVATIDGPCEGADIADMYQQFLTVRVPQEKMRPALRQLALKWKDNIQNLTPQQLCNIYSVHNRLNIFTKEAFRALGKELLKMDPSHFEIEDVVEILSVNMSYMMNMQDTQVGKSVLWDTMLRRHRSHWGTSPVVQVMLKRAEEIPNDELDVQETLGLLNVMVKMEVHRPKLMNKLLRRVSDLQDEIEGQRALKYFHLVAQHPEHTEGTVELVKSLLQKSEEYVQQIRNAEDRLHMQRELGPLAGPEISWDREQEIAEQRRAARLAAQEVTNVTMAVAEGIVQYTPHLVAEDRRSKASFCNRIAKAAQLQGVALQTDPDKFVGPPFMVQEAVGTLLALGRAAEIGAEFGDAELADVTSSHTALVEFTVARAKAVPSELYAPRDLVGIMQSTNLLMWRDEELIHKMTDQATATEILFSPLQVNQMIAYVERMKVLNRNFNNHFYMNQYSFYMIDTLIVVLALFSFSILASYVWDMSNDHEDQDEVWS